MADEVNKQEPTGFVDSLLIIFLFWHLVCGEAAVAMVARTVVAANLLTFDDTGVG